MGRALARGSSLTLVIFACGHAVNFVTQVVLARHLGRAEYGIFAWVSSWAIVLNVLAGIGLDTTALRFLPTYRVNEQWGLLRGFLWRAYAWTLLGAFIVAGLTTFAVLAASGFHPGHKAIVFVIGVWVLPASAVLDLQVCVARAMRRMLLAYMIQRILSYLAVLIGALALLAITVHLTATNIMLVSVLTLFALVFGQFVLIWRGMYPQVSDAESIFNDRLWITVAVPLMGVALMGEVMKRTDVLMIGWFLSPQDVGAYNVATRIASQVAFVLLAVNAMAGPMIAHYHARGDRQQLQRLLSLIAQITFWPSILIASGMAIFATPLLNLFGKGFNEGHFALLVLLGGQVINAGAGSVGYVLSMTGHERDSLRVYGISAGFNVIAVYVGIRIAGINGAAVATAITIAMWNIWLHQLTIKYLGVYPSVLSLAWVRRRTSVR